MEEILEACTCTAELNSSSKDSVHSLLRSLLPSRNGYIIDITNSVLFTGYSEWLLTSSSLLGLCRGILKTLTQGCSFWSGAEVEDNGVPNHPGRRYEIPQLENTVWPFKDDNYVRRYGGRLQNTSISFLSKHPILLDKQHNLAALIVQSEHHMVQWVAVTSNHLDKSSVGSHW